jgi:hypothetical protein
MATSGGGRLDPGVRASTNRELIACSLAPLNRIGIDWR